LAYKKEQEDTNLIMIQFFPTDRVILLPGLKTMEVSAVQLARFKELYDLGIIDIPIGRRKDGYVEVFTACEFVEAVKKISEIREIQVDVRDFNEEQIAEVYCLKYPLQSQVENLTQQGFILENHLFLKNLKVSQVIKAFHSEGIPYTRQYANLLTGFAQSPTWLQGVIQTYPRLKSLPSKLLPFASYKDFWNCLKDSLSKQAENLSKITSRQFNQLLSFFKPMLCKGQEEEACRLLANSSIQDLVEQQSFLSTVASPLPSTTCNDLHDEALPPKSLVEHVLEEHFAKSQEIQKIHNFHFSRTTRKGFSPLNETRGRYWNVVIGADGEIKPFYIGEMLARGVFSADGLKTYLDQISEYKELEADYLTLLPTAPDNPYIENHPHPPKSFSTVVEYKSQRVSPHKGQVAFDCEKINSSQFWSTLHAAIDDMNKIRVIEIKGISPNIALKLGLNVVDGQVLWFPSAPVSIPHLSEGVIYPKYLICTSMDETLLTPHTPGKILSLVPLESGPPAIECQFPDKNRVLPLNSVRLHPKDQLKIERATQNRARN
jgi:hypothetical protein